MSNGETDEYTYGVIGGHAVICWSYGTLPLTRITFPTLNEHFIERCCHFSLPMADIVNSFGYVMRLCNHRMEMTVKYLLWALHKTNELM